MIGPFKGEYGFLSNFYPASMIQGGAHYKTVEHYYQAMKAAERPDFNRIIAAATAAEAKRIGRSVKMLDGFEPIKRTLMTSGIILKFGQNSDLREKLIATGTEHLEEVNYWGDTYWGTCNGIGENWLGKVLMIVRGLYI